MLSLFSPSLLLFLASSQTEKFSGAVPHQDSPSPVSTAAEAGPGQEEEHENMKNLLISSSNSLTADQRGLRRSRAVRSKTLVHLSTLSSSLFTPLWLPAVIRLHQKEKQQSDICGKHDALCPL